MTPLLIAIVGLVGVALTAAGTWAIAKRAKSGRVATTEAETLWAEAKSFWDSRSDELRTEINELRREIVDLRAELVVLRRHLATTTGATDKLEKQVTVLEENGT